MRQVVLDIETTGLEWRKGNRIIEIGCVEVADRKPTGRTWHHYLRPDCDLEPYLAEVTGLTREILVDMPPFGQIADELLAFIKGAELVIHNASFDIGFLDYELSLLGLGYGRMQDYVTITDTLMIARERYPDQRCSVDALCQRLGIDVPHDEWPSALRDARLTAEIYLGMT